MLPVLEELQTAWEKKHDTPKYVLYKPALTNGLEKLRKHYSRLDDKPSFVLALGKDFAQHFRYILMNHLQCFIRTTSLLTLNSPGVVQQRKLPKSQEEILPQRTGMTRRERLLKIQFVFSF